MFDALVYVFLFGIGLAVGSFVNVAVLRFGFSESPQARSHCMACGRQIASYDLIPFVSYVALKGHCRTCGSGLSVQYPIVELSVAALFVLAYAFVPPQFSLWAVFSFVALLIFLAGFVALVVYDFRHTLVPLPFVYMLAGAALAAALFQSVSMLSWEPILEGVAGGASLFGFFFAIYLVTRGRGMGLGDAYVAGAIGILLGFLRGIEAIMFAVWIGTALYLSVMFLSSRVPATRLFPGMGRVTIDAELPFVPLLLIGALLALFTNLSPLSFGVWFTHILWFSGN